MEPFRRDDGLGGDSGRGDLLAGSTFGVCGCGAVGSAFAQALASRGAEVLLWSRGPDSLEGCLRRLEALRPGRGRAVPFEGLAGADAVLLCVHEDALPALAARLAEGSRHPAAVWHTCGYFGAEILAPLRAVGVPCGKLHPLLTLPRADVERAAARLEGCVFGLGGDPPALAAAQRLVEALAGRALVLRPGEENDRLYHAAASLVSGGYVALVDTAVRALAATLEAPREKREEEALGFLEPLRRATEENLHAGLGRAALTGPVARGAEELVAGHLEALRAFDPQAEELYRVLTELMRRLR